MTRAPRPGNEEDRLKSLRKLGILGAEADSYLDELARMASTQFGMPIVQVNFIDDERQWTMAAYGTPRNESVDRDVAFCSHTIMAPTEVTVVEDALRDPRFSDNPLVVGQPGIRFYAGACVVDLDGHVLGAICVADTKAHSASEIASSALSELSKTVSSRLDYHRVNAALRESEDHYRHAVELNPQIPFTTTPDGKVEETSPRRWLSMVGNSHGKPRGDGWQGAVHPDDLAGTIALWKISLRTGEPLDLEYRLRMADGDYIWCRARASPRRDASGTIIRWYGTLEDIDDRKLAELALRENEKRLRLSLRMGGLGSWELDFESRTIIASEGCIRDLGLKSGTQIARLEDWLVAIHPNDRERYRRDLDHARQTMLTLESVYRVAAYQGGRWIKIAGQILQEGGRLRMIGLTAEAPRQHQVGMPRHKSTSLVDHHISYDELTGLANQQALDEGLAVALVKSHSKSFAALLILDMDGFKNINLTLGTSVGDNLLRQIAFRLNEQIGDHAMLARNGGDQFAVVLTDMASTADVDTLAERLLETIDQPFHLAGQAIRVQATMGIALALDDVGSAEEFKHNALAALYRAKVSSRGGHQSFMPTMSHEMERHDALRRDLRKALTQDEMMLRYQPVINFDTGKVESFEALLRWRHPVMGVLPPSDFLPLAEKTGWIVSIGRWALLEACREAANWPTAVKLTLNLAAAQFSLGDLETDISQALAASGLQSSRLELEVAESFMQSATDADSALLQRLRRLGLRIVLGDFGSGNSSVGELARFGFDKIKIDQLLIKNVPDGGESDRILKAIIGLSDSLGITVAAKGVETPAQRAFLHAVGCVRGQGFLFGRPVDAAAVAAFTDRSWRWG